MPGAFPPAFYSPCTKLYERLANKAYKKSRRVVGESSASTTRTADTAVSYDTISAHGAGLLAALHAGRCDRATSVRSTATTRRRCAHEVRMARIGHELLADIDKENRRFRTGNYDGSEQNRLIMPARIPNLLINGSSGIAVGMRTNIPPQTSTKSSTPCSRCSPIPEDWNDPYG